MCRFLWSAMSPRINHSLVPMTLSHIVDTQVMLGSTDDARYRILRADKNRFGSVGELGFFRYGQLRA